MRLCGISSAQRASPNRAQALRPWLRRWAPAGKDAIGQLHALSNEISSKVAYQSGQTNVGTTAELVLQHAKGVCQDHVHVFLSAARLMGYPARYVSGYLMMNDRVEQDATHAWAEVYVEGLGWVGFDVSNAISPDERYVCAATGLDYVEAAPVSGMRLGDGNESLYVNLQVQQ